MDADLVDDVDKAFGGRVQVRGEVLTENGAGRRVHEQAVVLEEPVVGVGQRMALCHAQNSIRILMWM